MTFSDYSIDPLPKFVRLEPECSNLTAAVFQLMKLMPAEYILDRAAASGELTPRTPVIETSSGTNGLALALACHKRGYPLFLVGDPAITPSWRARMADLGARVFLVRRPGPTGGFQAARLEVIEELRRKHPRHFLARQYHNPDYARAYSQLAEMIVDAVGKVDVLVATAGSGASLCGTANALKLASPGLRVVAVDTFGSILFGQPDRPRSLRGLGNSILPENLRHEAVDDVHWVSARIAYRATRELYRCHRLYQGGTSGAAYLVARWYARRNPGANVVTILPDDGARYADTIFNARWIGAKGLRLDAAPEAPGEVAAPAVAEGDWCWFPWARRTYAEVTAPSRTAVGSGAGA